ncbi:MAM and LDL-receptor class a domain-containing protein 1 [Plakobranchus ocellatus]|uniref:MAM and LDL-receptor class a domain-containing protein 1 n=1 Tax=Plakobranchus ocellatus TaxID=259542 RepID=A0AAV4D1R4_9GAST|nr:MAM and LDL-receptor class a domain-containing protein 1 [Plakobranchus ocellatus]
MVFPWSIVFVCLLHVGASDPVRETFECSFDSGLCDFVQKTDDDFNWSRRSGSTLTVSTGPECDPLNCSGGQYLYIETSYPRTEGDRARIETPFIGGSGKHCLSFFSHMYGSTIGCLKVKQYSRDTNLETVLWEASGNQGNSWYQQRVTYESPSVYKIIFDATLGKADGPVTFTGDIAIDNVTIQIGACSGYSLFNCDFERDVCGWRNVSVPGQNFELSWVRHSGGTDTPNTGPTRDRTEYDGHYLYVESSRTLSGDLARLVSPNLERSSTGVCVKFWYHMYGQLSGTLTMYVQHGNNSRHEVWRTQGDKGEDWNPQNVNISSIHTDQDFTILFEAALQGSTGDVAIDDLSIQHSLCGS